MYDLEERTAKLGEEIIKLVRSLPSNEINRPLLSQIIRSGTSIGANYMEADGAESKNDFRHKVSICKKEAKETMHWLRLVSVANPTKVEKCRQLWKEVNELAKIFSTIVFKCKNK